MKKILNILLFVFVAIQMQAQEIDIIGLVSDQDDNMAMAGVRVLNKNSGEEVLTDFDGNYKISAKVGDEIVFTFIGYDSVTKIIDKKSTINLSLKSKKLYSVAQMGCYFGKPRINPKITYQYVTIKFN